MIIRLTTLNINLLFLFTIGLFLVSAGEYNENINIENKKETIPSLIGIVLGLLLQYFIWFYFYTLDIFIFYI